MKMGVKAVTTLADQVASSASNTLIVLAVAQTATVNVFGRIAFYLAVLTLALALVRGGFGTLLLLSSSRSVRSTNLECSLASAATLAIYAPFAVFLVAAGALNQDLELSLVVAAAGPALLLQDVQRHAVLARGQAVLALTWDGVWVAGSALLLVLTWRDVAFLTPERLIGGWGALALLSYVGLATWTGAWPRTRLIIPWLRRHLALRTHYAAEASVGALMTVLLFAASTHLAGEQAAAALRGASTLFGPLAVAMSAMPLLLLPAMAREGYDLQAAWRAVRTVTMALTGVALVTTALVLVLPDRVGTLLLGEVWAVTRPMIAYTGLEYGVVVWLSAAFTCWRSARMGGVVLRARVAYSSMTVVLVVVAAAVFGQAPMIALAMAVSAAIATVIAAIAINRPKRPATVNVQARVQET
jgi:hypothetical protein